MAAVTPPREFSDSDGLGTQSESGYTSPEKSSSSERDKTPKTPIPSPETPPESPEFPDPHNLKRKRPVEPVEDDQLFNCLGSVANHLKRIIPNLVNGNCGQIGSSALREAVTEFEDYWDRIVGPEAIGKFSQRDCVLKRTFEGICVVLCEELCKVEKNLPYREEAITGVVPLIKSLKRCALTSPGICQQKFDQMMKEAGIREVKDGFTFDMVYLGFDGADDRWKQVAAILDRKKVLYEFYFVDFTVTPPKAPQEALFLAKVERANLPIMQINEEPFTDGFKAVLDRIEERFPE